MKTFGLQIVRLLASVLLAYAVWALLGYVLDKLSELFKRETSIRNFIETLLVILAPIAFGFLVFVVLVVIFYWLLPNWFPRLRG